MQFLFFFLGLVAVFASLKVILSRNPIHCILYLILTFFSLSAIYIFMLNAQFIGIVNIIVYAGAIMVLFLHTVMFVNWNTEGSASRSKYVSISGMLAAGVLLIVITGALKLTVQGSLPGAAGGPLTLTSMDMGLVKNLGQVLFRKFLLPFEVASILFLSAMVGAVLLAKKEPV